MNSLQQIGTFDTGRALQQQKRTATITSLLIAILLMAFIGVILAFIFHHSEKQVIPKIVARVDNSKTEQEIAKPKIKIDIVRKLSAPSLASVPVITVNAQSSAAVPVSHVVVDQASLDFGIGDDFSGGFEGDGFESGGRRSTFFNQDSDAERVVYVIDYSASMRGKRDSLMRKELKNSVETMLPGTQFGMIFFAGPAWVAGDDVSDGVVTDSKGKTYQWTKGGSHSSWMPDGDLQKVSWKTMDDKEYKRLTEVVQKTPLVLGTVWTHPIFMALEMDPAPQVIYFMTDGAAGRSEQWAEEIGKRARRTKTVINTVAMMVPKAEEPLKEIAKKTGGVFTVVNEDGSREVRK